MANHKPWEGKLFNRSKKRSNHTKQEDRTALFFTVLMVAFTVIVTLIIGLSIYLSIGGSETGQARNAFFNSDVDAVASSSQAESRDDSETAKSRSKPSTDWSGNTLSVQAGEGAAAIAARAGITVERLYELNPEYLETGAWYANPGDVIKVD